jgi:hypothetical protein
VCGEEPRAIAAGTSGPDGSFAIPGLDRGSYRLLAAGAGWVGDRAPASAGQAPVWIAVRKERVLRGRVLVAEPGKEPRSPERFILTGAPFGRRELAPADGRFSVRSRMSYAKTPVSFSVQGFPPVTRKVDLIAEETDLGDVRVGPPRRLTCIVRDPGGRPVEGAEVMLATGEALGSSGFDGKLEANVAPGPVELRVTHPEFRALERAVAEHEEAVELRLSAGASLRLLAEDANGQPVQRAELTAILAGIPKGCRTDANGRCRIGGLAPGEWRILPRPAAPRGLVPASVYLRIDDGVERDLTIRFPVSPSRLAIRLLDAAGAETQGPRYVFPGTPALADALDARRAPRSAYHAPEAGAVENLAPGRYTVVALDGWARSCAMTVVDLKEGQRAELTLRLDDGSCR